MNLARRSDALTVEQQQRIDEICMAFEDEWLAARQPLIERHTQRVGTSLRPFLLLELLMIELEYRRSSGEQPDPAAYTKRFPNLESVVRQAFDTMARREVALRFLPGQRIGRYEIRAEIGTGSFGSVYRAWDGELQRDVAIKVPHHSFVCPEHARKRVLDEARAIAGLKHAGIVTIHDIGHLEDGTLFFVMQYIDGRSLAQRLQQGPLPIEQAVAVTTDIAEALACAHQAGIIHRDLKPGNILLDGDGGAHVADFGLALRESEQHLRAGEYAGTLAYMAPEQLKGQAHQMDGRADIWALGVLFYQMLTGRRPFRGANRHELINDILHRDPKPLRQIDHRIPLALERICQRCLARRPTDRFESARDIADLLRAWKGRAGFKRRYWPAAAGLVAAGLMVLLLRNAPPARSRTLSQHATPLAATFDLQIWGADGNDRQMTWLSDSRGRRPLQPYDKLRFSAHVNMPAFVYVVWLDTRGTPLPIYPWRNGDWNNRPRHEEPVTDIALPRQTDQAWPMGNDPPGMETLLLLVRATPLPANVDLRKTLRTLPAASLPLRNNVFWFENGHVVARRGQERGPSINKLKTVNDPVLQLQHEIVQHLRPHFQFIRAVSFPVTSDMPARGDTWTTARSME